MLSRTVSRLHKKYISIQVGVPSPPLTADRLFGLVRLPGFFISSESALVVPLKTNRVLFYMVNLPGVGPHSHDIRECRFVRIGERTRGYRDGLNYTAVKGDVIHTDNLVGWFDSIPIHQF